MSSEITCFTSLTGSLLLNIRGFDGIELRSGSVGSAGRKISRRGESYKELLSMAVRESVNNEDLTMSKEAMCVPGRG